MEYLFMISGGIVGWILIEVVAVSAKATMPIPLNLGMMFVGGVIGYYLGV